MKTAAKLLLVGICLVAACSFAVGDPFLFTMRALGTPACISLELLPGSSLEECRLVDSSFALREARLALDSGGSLSLYTDSAFDVWGGGSPRLIELAGLYPQVLRCQNPGAERRWSPIGPDPTGSFPAAYPEHDWPSVGSVSEMVDRYEELETILRGWPRAMDQAELGSSQPGWTDFVWVETKRPERLLERAVLESACRAHRAAIETAATP